MPYFEKSPKLFHADGSSGRSRWQIFWILITVSGAVAFTALVLDAFRPRLAPALLPILALALCLVLYGALFSLQTMRKDYGGADQAFRNADCEFSSIFQSVLDGILIVDNEACCLDANPAATAILRVSSDKLIGDDVRRFFPDCEEFRQRWSSLLKENSPRTRTSLTGGDGTPLFVEVAVTANYLPGRHVVILCDATERTNAEIALRKSEERFRYMADNIQEIFWMMDPTSQEITYVNPAYATITGYGVSTLRENPWSYRDLIHPEDRIRILSKLHDLAQFGTLDEEFRFLRADGEVRWAWTKGILVPATDGKQWLVGTAQDITSRKQAEMKILEQFVAVDAARTEAEALRKATLALSRNLAMDSVLDTLLQCILDLIPYDRATVLFVEDGADLMVAREAPRVMSKRIGLILSASESVFLQHVLFEKQAVLLTDISKHPEWRDIQPLEHVESWLGVPLISGGRVLGILSLGAHVPSTFTTEHLRVAKSLALPAAVAIQNARAHERAEIYAAELETRLQELNEAQTALKSARRASFNRDTI